MTNTKTKWEEEITDMLRDAGLKPIHFKLNNAGIRIINRIKKERADARREVIEEIENKLESIQFVYEHQWTDEAVEKLCERCGEVIKIGTPCEASIHITCWKLLESVLATLRKEEKHG